MSKKSMQTLGEMSGDELKSHEADLREELFSLRFKNRMRQLDNPLRIRSVRKDIARVRTLLSQQAKAAAKEKTR